MTVYAGTRPMPINLVTSNLLLYVNGGSPFSYRPGTNQPIWEDLSGNNNHMTIGANASFSSTYDGGLRRGASGNIATSPTLNLSGNCSVAFWIKTLVPSGDQDIMTYGSHRIFHTSSGTSIYYSWPPYNFCAISSANNGLFYVTATYNNSTKIFSLYSGTTLAQLNDGSGFGATGPGASTTFTLGGTTAYQNLEIYSLQVYNTVLTSTQITQNYNATRTRFGV